MVGFQTLDTQAYFSYDLNFAGKPEEGTRRNMISDCVLQKSTSLLEPCTAHSGISYTPG